MPSILREICTRARADVAALKQQTPLARLRSLAEQAPLPPSMIAAVRECSGVALIAECKKRSPSAGVLRDPYEPVKLARAYERAGARAVSCLTNAPYFGGSLEHLREVAAAVSIPVLRKEFVVDPYQVWEARAAGAAAILLIVAALSDAELRELLRTCAVAGLEALVEVHNRAELARAQAAEAQLIGVNNRDLHDFSVDPRRVLDLSPEVDDGVLLVAESGIESAAMVSSLRSTRVQAVLVGTALVRSADPGAVARLLVEAGGVA